MLLRQIQEFLAAAAEPKPAQAAGADGIQGLDDLVALVGGRGKGVAPGDDARGGIGEKGQQHADAGARRREGRDKPAEAQPAEKEHRAGDGDEDDRGGEMRLEHQQADQHREDAREGQHAPAKAPHPAAKAADQHRKAEDHGELGQFRGLQRQSADPEPAPGAVGTHAHKGHQQQEQHRQSQEGKGTAPVKAHRKARGQPQRAESQRGEQQLPHEIVGRAAAGHMSGVVVGAGVARREHHHHTDREQQQHQQEKGPVKAPAPIVFGCRRKIGEAGTVITQATTSPISCSDQKRR